MPGFPLEEARELAALVARQKPRVHVLTNPVAQAVTANALAALGAEPSMSAHPRDILPLARGANAIALNLGMLEPQREAAIEALSDALEQLACPIVLDPVMADRVPYRGEVAARFFGYPRLIVKGNGDEMAALALSLPAHVLAVTTGEQDRVGDRLAIAGGHPLLARFSGSGCLAGAVMAAFAAVEPDRARAAGAALTFLRHAAEKSGAIASGPGTFVPLLIDALAASVEV
ncbi:MAG: hydroxyethylthiazole kinase [Rhizobiales bacterium]|nr:hydroxyethylthiazole kinase [Hyphomicrobiales bacterium]